MERPRLIPQIYGYAVCLVSVITILVATSNLVNAVFDSVSPEMSREITLRTPPGETQPPMTAPNQATATVRAVPDTAWERRTAEERTRRIAAVRHHGLRSLVSSSITLLLAIGLFLGHWRWLRGLGRGETV